MTFPTTLAKAACLLLCTGLAASCSSGASEGPANPRVAEIETTVDRGGDITIRRSKFVYESGKLKEVRYIENGSDDGRMEFLWDKGG